MNLSDFSSFIELSAALNVAFIAIEYAKSFTRGIVKRLFKYHNLIEGRMRDCLGMLYDESTIDNISHVTFEGGRTTEGQLNEAKRKYKKLRDDILKSKEELCDEVDSMCSSNCLPTLCLFLFLYNLAQLFVSAFTPESTFLVYKPFLFFACSFFFLTVLTFLFLIISWILAEHLNVWVDRFSSSRYTGITFFICVVASLVLAWQTYSYNEFITFVLSILDVVIVVGASLTFINLAIVLLLLREKGNKAVSQIGERYKRIEEECNAHNEEMTRHMHGAELETASY